MKIARSKLICKCKSAPVLLFLLSSLFYFPGHAQLKDTTLSIQYIAKGFVLLKNSEKVSIKGLNYLNEDSVILFEKGVPDLNNNRIYSNHLLLLNVNPRIESIGNIQILKDGRHARIKGGGTGALIGFGLGYLAGFLSYEDKFDLSDDENKDKRKTRGFLYALGGAVPVGLTGVLIGGLVLRKKFVINGNKDKLYQALQKIY